jgi:serine/threonine protein kinase
MALKEFKAFKTSSKYVYYENFDLITNINKKDSEGTYGEIMTAKWGNTNIALKRFKDLDKLDQIPNDIIKEILILQHLNNLNIDCVVKYYGLIVTETDIYLMLEELFEIMTINNPPVFINLIIDSFTKLHNAGIIHNDIKKSNIMCNFYGDIKIIDFGISEFFGLAPLKCITNNYICTENTKAPDLKNMAFYCNNNRKSYSSDLYSLGITLIHYATNNYNYTYLYKNNIIQDRKNITDIVKKHYGSLDIIKTLINHKSINRYIYHEDKLFDIDIKTCLPNISNYILTQSYLEYNYIEAIHKTYENDIYTPISINLNSAKNINILINLNIYHLDTLINGIICYRNINSDKLIDLITICNYFTGFFDYEYPDEDILETIINIDDLYNNSYKFLTMIGNFRCYPIWVHLYYAFLKYKINDDRVLELGLVTLRRFIAFNNSKKIKYTFYILAELCIIYSINYYYPDIIMCQLSDNSYKVFVNQLKKLDKYITYLLIT